MKKIRFISIFFLLTFFTALLTGPAGAYSSEILNDMEVNCGSCLLEDMDTNTVLYGQENDKRIYPASVTKILTALVVLQHVEAGDLALTDTITASNTFQKGLTYQAASGNIQSGEQLTVENLLYMLLLPSHCDAANVLAEAVSGSVKDFAAEMTQAAQDLGCQDSNFVNPSGLHNKKHYTTCNDLYLIAKAAYQYDTYRTIIGSAHYTVPATNLSEERRLHNTNALICDDSYSTYLYDYCVGGKTGSTYPAGYCLLSYAEKDGRTLCCVMMGCNWLINLDGSRLRLQFSESVRLYKWGFKYFTPLDVVEKDSVQTTIPVTNARNGDTVELVAASDLTALVPKDIDSSNFTFEFHLPESISAPVSIGDVVGTLTVQLDGVEYGTVDLLAADTRDEIPKIFGRLHEFQKDTPLLDPLSGAVLLIVLLFAVYAVRQMRKR